MWVARDLQELSKRRNCLHTAAKSAYRHLSKAIAGVCDLVLIQYFICSKKSSKQRNWTTNGSFSSVCADVLVIKMLSVKVNFVANDRKLGQNYVADFEEVKDG